MTPRILGEALLCDRPPELRPAALVAVGAVCYLCRVTLLNRPVRREPMDLIPSTKTSGRAADGIAGAAPAGPVVGADHDLKGRR